MSSDIEVFLILRIKKRSARIAELQEVHATRGEFAGLTRIITIGGANHLKII